MKSFRFFKPTLALTLGLHPSFRSAVAGKPPGERNVYMYDSIQLSKIASSRTTSQVTWPNDNKAVGNCFQALIAGLRPASLILAQRIAFPLVLLGAGLVLIQPCAGQSGTWTPTGSHAHAGFIVQTATLLPQGKVLVAGSYPVVIYHPYPHVSYVASAELYDPASGTWAVTGIPVTGISSHTATLLPSGEVLVAGASAELYDPASGTWSATGSFGTARDDYTMTLLPNGKVLVSGGFNSVALASAELYDPARGTWNATGSLHTARHFHTATLLPNGKVLVAGGADVGGIPLASAELYDPASGTWTTTGSLATARFLHTETLLPNGKVFVAGGEDLLPYPQASTRAELYDPVSGTWTTTGSLNTARSYGDTATLLPNGKVLVAGGTNSTGRLASAELYDPASGTWAGTGSLVTARSDHTAALLPDGNVLVGGGFGSSGPLASAELYVPPRVTGPPVAITNPATLIASFSAKLNGSVNPHGLTTIVYFQYGTTTGYGLTTAPQTRTGNTSQSVSAHISGLIASTTYHFRIVTTNSAGTRYGSDRTFATLPPTGFPIVTTKPATDAATSSATLNGLLDPHGLTTSVNFQYGTTTNYGRTTPMQSQTGNTFRNIAANIVGLASNTTYHFRIVATNSVGTRCGSDRTFTTQ